VVPPSSLALPSSAAPASANKPPRPSKNEPPPADNADIAEETKEAEISLFSPSRRGRQRSQWPPRTPAPSGRRCSLRGGGFSRRKPASAGAARRLKSPRRAVAW
jgi:hypothetical protein